MTLYYDTRYNTALHWLTLERPWPGTEGEDWPDLVVVIVLTLVVAPEVRHGEEGGQHDAGHQAEPQEPPEGTGWLAGLTRFTVVNVLLSSDKAGQPLRDQVTELLPVSGHLALLVSLLGLGHLQVGLLPGSVQPPQLCLHLSKVQLVTGELGEGSGPEAHQAEVQLEQRVRNLQQVRLCLL